MSEGFAERRTWMPHVTLTLLFLLAFAIREFTIARTSFWIDEIIAVTHTLVPFFEIPLHLVRFDMHPPLYFLQLDIWSWSGQSDAWFRLNSVLWSSGAVTVVLLLQLATILSEAITILVDGAALTVALLLRSVSVASEGPAFLLGIAGLRVCHNDIAAGKVRGKSSLRSKEW